MNLITGIKRILKTGKVEYGTKKAIENVLHGNAKLIITSENASKETKEDLIHYAKEAKVPVIEFKGTALELGEVCGKPFLIANLTVLDAGDVDIKNLTEA